MWYSNMYRRHLCDMHIEDWSDEFLSEFSPEKYVENLKLGKVQNAMIYFQSHAGHCYFPTKTGHMHRAFEGREDMIKRTVDLCHENGIKVTGYYSLNYNTYEHDRHPEWRMVQNNGKSMRENGAIDENPTFGSAKASRYGLLCPNNPEHRAFVYKQIDEMFDYFDFEGMFFDMPFWPYTCYCDKCRERWANEVGGEIPVNPVSDNTPEFHTLVRKKTQWMGEWIQSVTDYVKKINPDISVEHNFASGIASNANAGCAESVNDACDFVGGDLYGGILNHSVACKFYKNITKNAPFDYMFSRCKPALRMHTLTKSRDEMKVELMVTAAHHGATMVIDAIDPKGTMDRRFYEQIGELFDYESRYEPFFKGQMREDIGVYYDMKSRIDARGEKCDSLSCVKGIARTLIREHVPFGVVGAHTEIEKSKALLIPSLTDMSDYDFDRIYDYLVGGGKILLSGMESAKLTEKLLGCKAVGRSDEKSTYIAPVKEYEKTFLDFNADYPFPYDGSAALIECDKDTEILAHLTFPYTKPLDVKFASIHSDPPGIRTSYPAVVRKQVGKGEIIWTAVNFETSDIYEYGKIYFNLLSLFGTEYSFTSDAISDVEITVFDSDEQSVVHTAHVREEAIMPTVAPFTVKVRVDKAPKSVALAPELKNIKFNYDGEFVTFTTEPMHVYDMYVIKY